MTLYMSFLFKTRQPCFSVFDKDATMLPLMMFRCWFDFPAMVFYYDIINMLKIPCEVSQCNTHACWWCTSSCSSALHRCWCRRLQTDGMQIIWFETSALSLLSQDRTQDSALLCNRKWIKIAEISAGLMLRSMNQSWVFMSVWEVSLWESAQQSLGWWSSDQL